MSTLTKGTLYFDFDGTLHQTAAIYREAVQVAYTDLAERLALEPKRIRLDQASRWLGLSPKAMWQDFMPDLNPVDQACASALVGNKMVDLLKEGQGKLFDGTLDVLNELKHRGYRLRIVSNCKRSYAETVTTMYGLESLIDSFTAAEDFDFIPKFQIVTILSATHKGENPIAFIGDRQDDMLAGRHNDLTTVACSYGYGGEDVLEPVDYVIKDIRELLTLFS